MFTPFYKACRPLVVLPDLWKPPASLVPPPKEIESEAISTLGLLPNHSWTNGFNEHWIRGEQGAHKKLQLFLKNHIQQYSNERDRPDQEGVSQLSPHLHFGEISPQRILHEAKGLLSTESYIRQLFWREFSTYQMLHFPTTTHQPLKPTFHHFPWQHNEFNLKQWQQGKTGYPLVDAGMRQLWQTGWMHNRVRMVTASFLVKHLLISWQEGAQWFWDTLVDADLANNTMGWQWIAGCGADASPYFRIFNPILQSKKFDPNGNYIRQWVPELSDLPKKYIHEPWLAPIDILTEHDIILGDTYPEPIVNHAQARDNALNAYQTMKESSRFDDK